VLLLFPDQQLNHTIGSAVKAGNIENNRNVEGGKFKTTNILLFYNNILTAMANKSKNNRDHKTRKKMTNSYKTSFTKTQKNKCPVYHPYIKFEEDYSGHLDPKKLIETNLKSKTDYVKKLKLEYTPSNITPQSDFYSYINYKWVSNIKENMRMCV
jgi:hypothetical protein